MWTNQCFRGQTTFPSIYYIKCLYIAWDERKMSVVKQETTTDKQTKDLNCALPLNYDWTQNYLEGKTETRT